MGCITTGIVMVLLAIDLMGPKRNSLKSMGLVERGRMPLFGKKTSNGGKFAERKTVDRMDVLKQKIDMVNKKLDRVIEIVGELKSSNRSSLEKDEFNKSESTYHVPKYSYRYSERTPLSSKSLFNKPYYLGEKTQIGDISDVELPEKSLGVSSVINSQGSKYSGDLDLHGKATGVEIHGISISGKPSSSAEIERKPESSSTPSSRGFGVSGLPASSSSSNTVENVVSSGESLEKLIGEFLNESFSTVLKPSTSEVLIEDGKQAQDKSKALKESNSMKNGNGQLDLGSSQGSVSRSPLSSKEKKEDIVYAKKDGEETKTSSSPIVDRKLEGPISREASVSTERTSKPLKPEAKALSSGLQGGNEKGLSHTTTLHLSDGSTRERATLVYPSESEASYEDVSSSGGDDEGATDLRNRGPRPRISVIKL